MSIHGPLAPGSTFGSLRIVGLLGKGGMGAVYRAHDANLGRDVALKVVFREFANDKMFVERFAKEQASAAINHPHVVRVHGGGVEQGIPYLVMELLPGGTLSERLKREGRIAPLEAARLGSHIASALAAVHANNLVHRDLKPANVLLDEEGNAKLSDFGVVRTESSALTKTGELLGTPQYMAPEQVESGKHVDFRADLYSLGATLYALLTGHPPFDGPGYVVIGKKLAEVPTSTSSEVDDVPPALDRLIAQLLARHPQERPESAAAVAKKLDLIARRKAVDEGWSVRHLVLLAAALAALAAVVAVAIVVVRGKNTTVPPVVPTPNVPVTPADPDLVIDEPRDGALVTGDSVRIRGRAKGATSVEVAKKPVTVGADGAFEATVPVEDVEVAVSIVANGSGKRVTRTVYKPPVWFYDLPDAERPALPFPKGVTFGAKPLEYLNRKDESVLVYAPPTRFLMGGEDAGIQAPQGKKQEQHEVQLSGFFIGKYEVSVAQFEKFTKESRTKSAIELKKTFGLNFWAFDGQLMLSAEQDRGVTWRYPQRPPQGQDKGYKAEENHPVTQVTPDDADAYCKWAGLKLPTEAQWERAAGWEMRTQRSRRYPWGDGPPSNDEFLKAADTDFVAGLNLKVREKAFPAGTRFDAAYTLPVDSCPKGVSPIGAHNMAGNVAELCRDALDADFYLECAKKGCVTDPCLPGSSTRRVHRGGHFGSLPSEVLTKRRFYTDRFMAGAYRYPCDVVGFRVCRELPD